MRQALHKSGARRDNCLGIEEGLEQMALTNLAELDPRRVTLAQPVGEAEKAEAAAFARAEATVDLAKRQERGSVAREVLQERRRQDVARAAAVQSWITSAVSSRGSTAHCRDRDCLFRKQVHFGNLMNRRRFRQPVALAEQGCGIPRPWAVTQLGEPGLQATETTSLVPATDAWLGNPNACPKPRTRTRLAAVKSVRA